MIQSVVLHILLLLSPPTLEKDTAQENIYETNGRERTNNAN